MIDAADLPNPRFVAETADYRHLRPKSHGGIMRFYPGLGRNAIEHDPVLAGTPLASSDWSRLFAYMHRRFGQPSVSTDNHKDFSAGWVLTSPDPNVFVAIRPYPNDPSEGPWNCFGVHVASDEPRSTDGKSMTPARHDAIAAAYRAVLLDLLRPVTVRDSHINALGELQESPLDEALMAYDDDDEEIFVVDQNPDVGKAMPAGMFGGEDWGSFCALIAMTGGGDVAEGRRRLIQRMRSDLLAAIRRKDVAFRRVFYAIAGASRVDMLPDLDLNSDDIDAIDEQVTAVVRFKSRDFTWLDTIDSIDGESLDDIFTCFKSLGMKPYFSPSDIEDIRADKAVCGMLDELKDVAGGELPDEILDADFLSEMDPIATVRSKAVAIGHQNVVAWMDGVMERPDGRSILWKTFASIATSLRARQEPRQEP